jgi:hypothetical protein
LQPADVVCSTLQMVKRLTQIVEDDAVKKKKKITAQQTNYF